MASVPARPLSGGIGKGSYAILPDRRHDRAVCRARSTASDFDTYFAMHAPVAATILEQVVRRPRRSRFQRGLALFGRERNRAGHGWTRLGLRGEIWSRECENGEGEPDHPAHLAHLILSVF
jgi:hypothetical protein